MFSKCGLYLRAICHQPINSSCLSRYLCSKVGKAQTLTITQAREIEAVEWMKNLSPELLQRKRQVENTVQLMKEEGTLHTDLQLTSKDMKRILLECQSFQALRKYLHYLEKTEFMIQLKKEKRKKMKEQNEIKYKCADQCSNNVFEVHKYMIPLGDQMYKRVDNNRGAMIKNSSTPIIFDMDFKVSRREETRAISQIIVAFSQNKYFPEPCSIHITSYLSNRVLQEHVDHSMLSDFLNVHKEGFEELFPLEKLVYVSPDAPPLKNHTPGDIYVIGGLVDLHNTHTAMSLKKANELNIRCGSIPFSRYGIGPSKLPAKSGYVLTLDKVFGFFLQLNLSQQWPHVMKAFKASFKENQGRRLLRYPNQNRKLI